MTLQPGRLLAQGIILTSIALSSCGDSAKLDRSRADADYVIAHLHQPEVLSRFPAETFPPQSRTGVKTLVDQLGATCDWPSRDGKFVDFFTMSNNGHRSIAYIYEYFLKCDSLRFVLVYDLEPKEPLLRSLHVEPLEKHNDMIIDPSKQLLPGGSTR